MDIDFDLFFNDCKKHIKKFKSRVLDYDYETYKNLDYIEWGILFFIDTVKDPKKMKKMKDYLLSINKTEKDINKIFYFFLKSDYKYENGIFSFYESFELDLNPDLIKKTTTKFTIL